MKDRNLVLYYAAVFITNVGNSCAFLALGKFSLDAFGVASAYGLVLAFEQVKIISLSSLGGRLTDRFGAKSMAVFCDLLLFSSSLMFGSLALFGFGKFAILGTALIINFAKPFYSPALFALVRELVPSKQLPQINAGAAAAQQSGWVIGLLVAAWGITNLQPGWLIILDSSSYLVSGLCLYSCRLIQSAAAPSMETIDLKKNNFTVILKERFLSAVGSEPMKWMLVIAIQIASIVAYNVGLFSLVQTKFPGHPSYLSLLEFAFAGAVVVTAVFKGKAAGEKHLVAILAVQAACLAIMPLSTSILLTASLVTVFGLTGALIFPIAFSALYLASAKTNLGKVGALKSIVQGLIALPLLLIMNALLDLSSLNAAYVFLSLLSIVSALALIVTSKRKVDVCDDVQICA